MTTLCVCHGCGFLNGGKGGIIAPVDDPTAEPALPLDGYSHSPASNLLSLCQTMLLHPRGPDRHPIIAPSHEPRAFFHIP